MTCRDGSGSDNADYFVVPSVDLLGVAGCDGSTLGYSIEVLVPVDNFDHGALLRRNFHTGGDGSAGRRLRKLAVHETYISRHDPCTITEG